MKILNKREHPRYPVELECQIGHPSDRAQRSRRCRSKDLSRAGIALHVDEPVEIGLGVDLSIALVFGGNTYSESLNVRAQVVWCTPIGGAFQLGAKFVKMTDEQRGFLDVFLKFLSGELEQPPQDGRKR